MKASIAIWNIKLYSRCRVQIIFPVYPEVLVIKFSVYTKNFSNQKVLNWEHDLYIENFFYKDSTSTTPQSAYENSTE